MARQVYCDTVLFTRSDAVRLVRDAELYIPIITSQYGTYFYRTLMLRVVPYMLKYRINLSKSTLSHRIYRTVSHRTLRTISQSTLPCHIGPHSPYRIASYRKTSYLSFHVIQYRTVLTVPYRTIHGYRNISCRITW